MTTHFESLVLIISYLFNDVMNVEQLKQNCGERLKNIIQFERMIYSEALECQVQS